MFLIFLIAGLILRFAINSGQANGVNVHMIGDILLAVCAVLVVLTMMAGGSIARSFRG